MKILIDYPLGETAIEFRSETYSLSDFLSFKNQLESKNYEGIRECVAYPNSLLVLFNPILINYAELCRYINELIPSKKTPEHKLETVNINVCYDIAFALDYRKLEQKLKLSFSEIIQLHSKSEYQVDMFGFVPGFAYLSGIPEELRVGRKSVPSTRIPAGSVAIAHKYTGIYPTEVPGGWYVIGNTNFRAFNKESGRLFHLQPGQKVRFKAISKKEFERGM